MPTSRSGRSDRLRSFDPTRVASLESADWVAYYQRRWLRLVDALARLYGFVSGVAEHDVRLAAVHRCRAMEISDRWVAQGRHRDSPLIALERAALVRSYAALHAAIRR
ncbi:MAG TPA: hypothetical protein VGM53_29740 [Streptosporangiaceae bacterium]|jgi:hypothetical protein